MKATVSFLATLFIAATSALAAASTASANVPRSAHWVIRTSDLKKTLDFLTGPLGMRVLRHEENDKPCPITCNGNSPTAWSKTMVGFATEDKAYAMEVTYNYGVEKYPVGSGLGAFAVAVDDLAKATAAAKGLGFPAHFHKGAVEVEGPDGYRFLFVAKGDSARAAAEPFLGVRLHVANASSSAAFYTRYLGMAPHGGDTGLGTKTSADGTLAFAPSAGRAADVVLSFAAAPSEPALLPPAEALQEAQVTSQGDIQGASSSGISGSGSSSGNDQAFSQQAAPSQVALVLRSTGAAPRVEQHEGRHAISLPAATLLAVYARIEAERPELIVHAIMELDEALGKLFIAIVKDFDGFEICLVSSETFDKAVASAADFKGPDYALRERLLMDIMMREWS